MKEIYVTLDWAANPITTTDGNILPRKAAMLINGKYYPKNRVGEWPRNPKTGKKLPIYEH